MSIPTWFVHASTPSECVPTSTRSASPPGDADAGIRTRITAVTGPYARRITPRRHAVAPAGIEPATSGFKVRRPSPAETPGLDVAAAIAAGLVANDFRALSADGARSPLYRTNENQAAASLASRTRFTLCTERVLAQAGGNPVFPRPLTGSPYGGRVMRVRVFGRRRIASNSRIRSRRGSGGLRPVSSHADLVGTRRTRNPQLSENEHAAG